MTTTTATTTTAKIPESLIRLMSEAKDTFGASLLRKEQRKQEESERVKDGLAYTIATSLPTDLAPFVDMVGVWERVAEVGCDSSALMFLTIPVRLPIDQFHLIELLLYRQSFSPWWRRAAFPAAQPEDGVPGAPAMWRVRFDDEVDGGSSANGKSSLYAADLGVALLLAQKKN